MSSGSASTNSYLSIIRGQITLASVYLNQYYVLESIRDVFENGMKEHSSRAAAAFPFGFSAKQLFLLNLSGINYPLFPHC